MKLVIRLLKIVKRFCPAHIKVKIQAVIYALQLAAFFIEKARELHFKNMREDYKKLSKQLSDYNATEEEVLEANQKRERSFNDFN